MVNEKIKIKVIFVIDKLSKRFKDTCFEKELISLRKKYIYKDISNEEFLKDKLWLSELKKLY